MVGFVLLVQRTHTASYQFIRLFVSVYQHILQSTTAINKSFFFDDSLNIFKRMLPNDQKISAMEMHTSPF